jgi:hypothetical protein
MNISAVPNNTFPSIGFAITASQGGKASLPVAPSAYIYSQFKHVSGIRAPEGVQGVNINKLKIIDALIEQLTKMKQQPEPLTDISGMNDEKRINALINQLHTTQMANANKPYAPAAPNIGTIFNFIV